MTNFINIIIVYAQLFLSTIAKIFINCYEFKNIIYMTEQNAL